MIPHGKQENSYFEQYKRVRGLNTDDLNKQHLLTDRSVYLSFLESQLERVSASCLTVVGFKDRMLDVESQTADMDERLAYGLRRLKLHLPNFEEQEEKSMQLQQLQETVQLLSSRLNGYEKERKEDKSTIQTMEAQMKQQGIWIQQTRNELLKQKEEKTQDKSQPDGGSASWEGSWEKALGTNSN